MIKEPRKNRETLEDSSEPTPKFERATFNITLKQIPVSQQHPWPLQILSKLTSMPPLSWLSFSVIISLLISLFPVWASNNPDRPSSTPIKDIHDILKDFNLPKGILPNAVKSYSLSSEDGSFTVNMEHPCYVNFFDDDQIVYYDEVIKGKLSFGKVSHVSGIQAKKLFIWLAVSGMEIDSGSGMVQFFVGAFSQKFPATQFQTIPTCMNKGRLPLLHLLSLLLN